MAPEPQRAAQPHHLNPHIIPVKRALIARASHLEAQAADYERDVLEPDGAFPEFIEDKLTLAREFRALAAELHHW